jgi:hypothetical protein
MYTCRKCGRSHYQPESAEFCAALDEDYSEEISEGPEGLAGPAETDRAGATVYRSRSTVKRV